MKTLRKASIFVDQHNLLNLPTGLLTRTKHIGFTFPKNSGDTTWESVGTTSVVWSFLRWQLRVRLSHWRQFWLCVKLMILGSDIYKEICLRNLSLSVLTVAKNKMLSKFPFPYPQDTILLCHFREPVFSCLLSALNRFEDYNVVSWKFHSVWHSEFAVLFTILTCICLLFPISLLIFKSMGMLSA